MPMRVSNLIVLSILFFFFSLGCSKNWADTMKYGKIEKHHFEDSTKYRLVNKLIIVPVYINGSKYQFLFDTGAPTSISLELQDAFNFNTLTQGKIKDSDGNRQLVEYVKLDSIRIGKTHFKGISAFTADFSANPLIRCMEIDGIIGSNLMKECNWEISPLNNQITFSDLPISLDSTTWSSIDFQTDDQYNLWTSIQINGKTICPIIIDMGSNGMLSLPTSIVANSHFKGYFDQIGNEIGMKNSGLIGKKVETNRNWYCLSNFYLGEQVIRQTKTTISNANIGNGLLTNFDLKIDWDKKKIHFKPLFAKDRKCTLGYNLKLGFNEGNGIFVQSIVSNSTGHTNEVSPLDKVISINNKECKSIDDYCDYISLINTLPDSIQLTILNHKNETFTYYMKSI